MFFFFNDTATTEIYTLSLHDALPISCGPAASRSGEGRAGEEARRHQPGGRRGAEPRADRKSTRLNSSHLVISYAVFCLKKKNNTTCKNSPLIVPIMVLTKAIIYTRLR